MSKWRIFFPAIAVLLLTAGCGGDSGTLPFGPEPGEVRSIDGFGNNLSHPEMGMPGAQLMRLADCAYEDGMSKPMSNRPNPRVISNQLMAQESENGNSRELSSFVWQWGQFLDHDITLTPELAPHEALKVEIPAGDPYFDPTGSGAVYIPLNRSAYDHSTGTEPGNPRQQMTMITAWIDASNVYGSDASRAAWLRTFEGGRLKMSSNEFPPVNDDTQENACPAPNCAGHFVVGDVRGNEQTGLLAMHTLFVREHNRLADEFAAAHPEWGDDQIFQQARRFIAGFMQSITFNEFLPALLGTGRVPAYGGYQEGVDSRIANEFSTAMFRLGHSMIPGTMLRLDVAGNVIPEGNLQLRDAFFRPDKLVATGLAPVLRGLASQQMETIDLKITDDLRNFLFGPPGAGGLDLASLNILRGREHGLSDFNSLRAALGLKVYENFYEITSNSDVAETLAALYGDDINNIDPWIGALAEDHLPGASVGETIALTLLDQFTALRDGDRFWFEIDPNLSEIEKIEIKNTKLSDLIKRNSSISYLKHNVFYSG